MLDVAKDETEKRGVKKCTFVCHDCTKPTVLDVDNSNIAVGAFLLTYAQDRAELTGMFPMAAGSIEPKRRGTFVSIQSRTTEEQMDVMSPFAEGHGKKYGWCASSVRKINDGRALQFTSSLSPKQAVD